MRIQRRMTQCALVDFVKRALNRSESVHAHRNTCAIEARTATHLRLGWAKILVGAQKKKPEHAACRFSRARAFQKWRQTERTQHLCRAKIRRKSFESVSKPFQSPFQQFCATRFFFPCDDVNDEQNTATNTRRIRKAAFCKIQLIVFSLKLGFSNQSTTFGCCQTRLLNQFFFNSRYRFRFGKEQKQNKNKKQLPHLATKASVCRRVRTVRS